MTIKSFKDKETKKIFERQKSQRFPEDIQRTMLRKLAMLERAGSLDALKVPPSNHLKKLKGNRAEQYSIRINKQWRVCFYWIGKNAFDVEITDYH